MAKWRICGIASASKDLGVVEAKTKDDAITNAWNDETLLDEWYMSLCHQCASEIDIGDIYQLEAVEID